MVMNQDQFPILSQGIYANHAAIAPWPRVTAEAVAAFAEENVDRGPLGYRDWISRERSLRELAAQLIGAESSNDIALLKNTAECVSAVAYGYAFQPGDSVVIPAGEFPSNRLPWLVQRDRGVDVREVDIRADDDPETALLAAVDASTRILAISSVQFSDGLRIDVSRLGKACRDRGVLFFVDAIQQLGALPIDASASHVDFLAASAHKWMLGPEGIALFYCRESARAKIDLKQVGWHMYDYPWDFGREDWTPSVSARRFEAGSPNSLGQVALHASLQLLLDTGLEEIGQRILANTAQLMAGLGSLPGVSIRSPTEPARRSGIVNFSAGDTANRGVFRKLMSAGVNCALRDGGIRLSPHYYQDAAVMKKLLEYVEDAL